MRNPFKKKPPREPEPTGTCLVREFTGDGQYVGRCWYMTHDGICPRHGNVRRYLDEAEETGRTDGWPRDFELSKWDGNKWAEALRAEFRERDRTRL
jgi:hypothetical protein